MNEKYQLLAYIDPGTGSLVLQMVLAAFVGAGVFFRRTLSRIFRRRKDTPPTPPPNTTEQQPS